MDFSTTIRSLFRSSRRLASSAMSLWMHSMTSLLLAPEGAGADHLKALSRIARVLRYADTVAKIRGSHDAAAIHTLLSETPASHAA